MNPEERLLARRRVRDSGCWEWTGGTIKGYGSLTVRRAHKLAHRLAWETWRGPIPEGLYVLHHCDNPPCFNPDHLWLGTKADNNRDRDEKGRTVVNYGPRAKEGFARGEQHHRTTLAEDQVLAIYADPRTQKEIAAAFGVSKSCVDHIRAGRRWGHVTQRSR